MTKPRKPKLLSKSLLRGWPLPQPNDDGDKDERGRVLVVGGAMEMPGALILAATAALRAGAGKLQVAACRSIVPIVAAAVPESRVFALAETRAGAISASAAGKIAERANRNQAVLIGPGMIDEKSVARLVKNILPRIDGATVVLDAAALSCFSGAPDCLRELEANVIITPHAKEMASMLGIDVKDVEREPLETARRAARRLNAVVALKGRETFIVAPDGEAYSNRAGNVGLATSGSGDVLAGIIAGLAARGAEPLQAAAWGVFLHGSAGDRLEKRVGSLGYLAREISSEIPSLMASLLNR